MSDASSIRKTSTPLAPTGTNPGPNPGSLPSTSASGSGFYESAIRFQLNGAGYNYTYTDSNNISRTRATGQAFVNSGAQWVPVGNVVLSVPLQVAADDVAQYVFVADRPYNLVSATEVHAVVASGTCTVAVNKCPNTTGSVTAPSAGTAMLTAAFDVHGVTAGTVTAGALSATLANTQLNTGDAIGLVIGTATGLVGATITLVLQPQ